ncbi:DciA family protein [Desulforhopalus singaporensis]|uniref:DUF721 domain-containing protein n=1 Tax=Desulforhopalus singaporensis TaxID=91360 RepID=A0A1H0JKW3_9BACT|nr:DUF721 domain-containing protein [Desulforhopalus singaporensis]SDO44418.1 Protein of unknown function [Desulforhopalus singaporensis]
MAKKKTDTEELIAATLPRVVRDKGWEKQLELHKIFVHWRDLVDEEVHVHAAPLKIERGILWIEVENSSWLAQLQYRKVEMLENFNSYLQMGRIVDIRMVLPREKEKNPHDMKDNSGPLIRFVPPSKAQIAEFSGQVGIIKDEKCREALMQFWYLANACRKEKK